MWITRGLGTTFPVLVVLFGLYAFFAHRDIERVDAFCSQVQAGFDVRSVAGLAQKLDVGMANVKDPTSVDRGRLGVLDNGTWVFPVVSPYTLGERGCLVRHDGTLVLSVVSRRIAP